MLPEVSFFTYATIFSVIAVMYGVWVTLYPRYVRRIERARDEGANEERERNDIANKFIVGDTRFDKIEEDVKGVRKDVNDIRSCLHTFKEQSNKQIEALNIKIGEEFLARNGVEESVNKNLADILEKMTTVSSMIDLQKLKS